jgi:hypothetical protein
MFSSILAYWESIKKKPVKYQLFLIFIGYF